MIRELLLFTFNSFQLMVSYTTQQLNVLWVVLFFAIKQGGLTTEGITIVI